MNSKIEAIIHSLYGKKCQDVGYYFYHGPMILIDFGEKRPYVSASSGKKVQSWEWTININLSGSEWVLRQNKQIIASNADDAKEIDTKVKAIKGKSIDKVDISDNYFETDFEFEGDLVMQVKNKKTNMHEDWSLKTPTDKHLIVGKGKWRYVSSDTKIGDWDK